MATMPPISSMTAQSQQEHVRDDLLDGLRFFAALAVLFYHYAFRAWNEDRPGHMEYSLLGPLAQYGYLGVDLFFMISGFVILMSAARGGPGNFVLSRVVRLYPAYWCCVLLSFAFLAWWHRGTLLARPLSDLLPNLSMLQSFFGVRHIDGVYWTLVVELHFYALILLVLLCRQMKRIDAVLAIWLLAALAVDHWPAALRELGRLIQSDWCHYFIAGAVAYRIRQAGPSALRWTLFGVAYVQAARHAHWYMDLKERLTQLPHNPWVVQTAVALTFLLFLLLALDRLRVQQPAMRRLGALTYPLYLIHGAIGGTLLVHAVQVWGWPRGLALAVVTAAALLAAWIIQTRVERPMAPRLRSFLAPWLLRR
jgi:peptidoglycan/LPS O-acetylase OafA/YrhL